MRSLKFTCLLIVLGITANAQFRIQPQIGLQNSKTTIQYNKESLVPMGIQFSPQVALRMEYKFKQGHGPYVGISTSSPSIDFNFSDAQTGNTYNASKQNIQLRLEAGYQFSTKPIYFSKPAKSYTSSFISSRKCGDRSSSCSGKLSCGRQSASCGRQSAANRCSKNSDRAIAKNKGSYLRIIPSAGFAFIPGQPSGIETITKNNQTSYAYKAGAWNTAFITGAGFEFGSNTSAKFIINVNYLKGLGNMDTETINNVSNGKPSATSISSKTSGWNISLGIPLSFNKKKPKIVERKIEYRKCGQYQRPQFHGRCGQYRMFDR